MKHNIRNIANLLFSAAMFALVALPVVQAATPTTTVQTATKTKTSTTANSESSKGICQNVDKITSGFDQSLANRQANTEKNTQSQQDKQQERRADNDAKLSEVRNDESQKRDSNITKLQSRATTAAQKQ